MRHVLFPIAILIAAPAAAQDSRTAIDRAMADSVAGWNAGDVDRFMALYSTAPSASFVTARGLVRGKPAMIANYRKHYDFSDAAKRGTLSIERLDYRTLGSDHALYIGRFVLTYPGGKTDSGYTSLVLAKERGGWKVIADHSS
ncbi:YybH family protein [Sphingomonas floccifaciens]|uniref:YybH family protein n=1 Tax=Sphingomonas floccifaciens TaxID=1844115 RepID=A0ABW4N8L4_9SPHN